MTRKKSPASNKAANPPKTTAKQKKPFGRCLADFQPLLPAEKKLLDAVAIGEICWLCDEQNPVRPEEKTKDNEIRADFIRFLALGGDEDAFVHEMGVQVAGAFLENDLNLINAKNVKAIRILFSTLHNGLSIGLSNIESLDLSNSFFTSLMGDVVVIESILKCDLVTTKGCISLAGAQIGHLSLLGASLNLDQTPNVLNCSSSKIRGSIDLGNKFKSIGAINLNSASIEGSIKAEEAHFDHPDGIALDASQMQLGGSIFFTHNFHSKGKIKLIEANIGGSLICQTSQFDNDKGIALDCTSIKVKGNIFLDKSSRFIGITDFDGAHVNGGVDCTMSTFRSPNEKSLNFQSAKIGSDVLLSNNFHAEGQVRFKNAQIGGDFKCERSSSIDNEGKTALHCEGIRVAGNVLLRKADDNEVNLDIKGGVNFMNARIGKGFDCSDAKIQHQEPEKDNQEISKYALNFQSAHIGGIFTLRNSELDGSLCLLKAHVDTLNDEADSWPKTSKVQKTGITQKIKNFFSPPWHWKFLDAEDIATPRPKARRISEDEGELQSVDSDETENTSLSTSQKLAATSADLSCVIDMDGFTYNQIAGGSPTDAATRLKWLRLQRESALWEKFKPQPFEQIISVLRKTGHEDAATQLFINKYDQKQKAKLSQAQNCDTPLLTPLTAIFFWLFLGRATGYGKRPARLLSLLIVLWGSAALWYDQAAQQDVFAPSHPLIFLKYDQKPDCRKNWVHCIQNANDDHNPEFQAYTVFSPWLYSFDVMIPILNLHQEGDWGPKMKEVKILGLNMPSWTTWCVMWAQIILGWLGSFMLIAMLSGWLQKE